jgi:hypothetical protein
MATCNIAMGATLMLVGSNAYSIDNLLLTRNPGLANRTCFRWLAGSLPLPISDGAFRNLGLAVLAGGVGVQHWNLRLLPRIGCHAVPQWAGQPHAAPLRAEQGHFVAEWRREIPHLP